MIAMKAWLKLGVLAACCSGSAYAACIANVERLTPDNRYTILPGGEEVLDQGTFLIWRRCSEGQTIDLSGTPTDFSDDVCTGTASTLNWGDALIRSQQQSQSTSQVSLRLPNFKELASLADTACNAPSVNASIFPGVGTINAYWSSTPVRAQADSIYSMQVSDGVLSATTKDTLLPVRLVR